MTVFQAIVGAQEARPQLKVAILIFDGVQIIDYTGPFEVLNGVSSATGAISSLKVFTVSEKPGTITTVGGMVVTPSYTFENAPKVDILVIPGGGSVNPHTPGVSAQVENPTVVRWVRETGGNAKYVLSVCNGAFIAAEAGLLDGLVATTTSGSYIRALRKNYPKIKEVVEDKRFVDNGKVVVTAGVTSGIDGSLHMVEKLFGRPTAKLRALGMEYNWLPESKYARAALAETKMPQNIYQGFFVNQTELLDFDGDVDKWEEAYRTPSTLSPTEMLQRISEKMASESEWSRADLKVSDSSAPAGLWKFTDAKGQVWNAAASVRPAPEKGQLLVTLKIFRAA